MKNTYINLFKKIYEAGELTIEPLGIKIKDLNTDTLTTHLFPILELDDMPKEPILAEVDIEKLRIVYDLYKKYQEQDLMRVALIGSDAKSLYEFLKKHDSIYEDEYNKTILKDDEIYLTTKNSRVLLTQITGPNKVLIIAYNFREVYERNDALPKNISNLESYGKKSDFSLRLKLKQLPNFLFFNLIESMGFANLEIDAAAALIGLEYKYVEIGINQINTNFFKTFVQNFSANGFSNLQQNSRQKSLLKKLIDNYSFDILKDLNFEEAVNIYVRW